MARRAFEIKIRMEHSGVFYYLLLRPALANPRERNFASFGKAVAKQPRAAGCNNSYLYQNPALKAEFQFRMPVVYLGCSSYLVAAKPVASFAARGEVVELNLSRRKGGRTSRQDIADLVLVLLLGYYRRNEQRTVGVNEKNLG